MQAKTAVPSRENNKGKRATARSAQCLICGRETSDGLRIRGETICRQCEARLVNTRVGSPGYDTYLRRLRRLWPETPVDE